MVQDELYQRPRSTPLIVVLAWLPVLLPLLWGIWQTVKKASVLFR